MNRAVKTAAAASGVTLALAGLFAEELYRYVFHRKGSALLSPFLDSFGHEAGYYVFRNTAADELRSLPRRELSIRSADGLELRGFYYPLGGQGRRIAFLIHGYRSEHAETAGMFLDYYRSRGVDLFCCDQRSHGRSEGRLIGFDVFEAEDCLAWVEELRRQFGPEVSILLHGFSMGAATVLRMAPRCPDCVKFLVEDSGYASAVTQLKGQLGPAYPLLARIHRLLSGRDLRESDVRPGLAESRLPILFVHGQDDPSVPFENALTLSGMYEGPKDSLFSPGTRHIETMYRQPERYARKLDAFLARYFP